MNVCMFTGHVVAAPEHGTTTKGDTWASFRIGVSRDYANADGVRESDFFNVKVFKSSADYAVKYFDKGMKVIVRGSMQNRKYTGQDGNEHIVTELIAERLEACGGNRSESSAANERQAYNNALKKPLTQTPAQQSTFAEEDIGDDDLPF